MKGLDDRDEMGICIEPPSHVIGTGGFQHWVYRTKPEGVPSGVGDLDLVVYSLRIEGNAEAHFAWVRDSRLVLMVDGATKIWSKDAHHQPSAA